jgi:sugar phosphate isomerase/epimerase
MIIGTMNHPQHDVVHEIQWMAELGLEFIDLTLEPPAAASWRVDPKAIRRALADHNMKVVGHTAYYLPFASPFEEVRRGTVDECKRCLEIFADLGAKWMNLHPDRHIPMHERPFWIERNLLTLHELLPTSQATGVGLMIENLPGVFNTAAELAELMDPLPALGLHLDIGHANLQVPHNTTEDMLARFGHRLAHVHLHDNNGGHADLHLPLGAGRMNWKSHLRTVKNTGYNATITLEVFTPDKSYVKKSRDLLRQAWDAL